MTDKATTESKTPKKRKFSRNKAMPVDQQAAPDELVEQPARKPRRKTKAAEVKKKLTEKQLTAEATRLVLRASALREKATKIARLETLRDAKANHAVAASALIELRKMLAKAEKDEVKALDKHNKARAAMGLDAL